MPKQSSFESLYFLLQIMTFIISLSDWMVDIFYPCNE